MSETNEHGAIGPLTGFIYQEYYFLYCLLTIQDGETVSLEKGPGGRVPVSRDARGQI